MRRKSRAGGNAECLKFEECVQPQGKQFSVCASSCESVTDCVDLSAEPLPEFAASVTCKVFSGAKRCVLACTGSTDCAAGMDCVEGACVWPSDTPGDDEAPTDVGSASWRDAYRECSGGGKAECLAFEDCISIDGGRRSVCASSCDTVANCVDLNALPAPTFSAKVACGQLEGARRCMLACKGAAECPPGATCFGGACLWENTSAR
jgi:hypothetical protein